MLNDGANAAIDTAKTIIADLTSAAMTTGAADLTASERIALAQVYATLAHTEALNVTVEMLAAVGMEVEKLHKTLLTVAGELKNRR